MKKLHQQYFLSRLLNIYQGVLIYQGTSLLEDRLAGPGYKQQCIKNSIFKHLNLHLFRSNVFLIYNFSWEIIFNEINRVFILSYLHKTNFDFIYFVKYDKLLQVRVYLSPASAVAPLLYFFLGFPLCFGLLFDAGVSSTTKTMLFD